MNSDGGQSADHKIGYAIKSAKRRPRCQVIPGKGDQAADAKRGNSLLIAAHRAVAFFDPPANGAFTIVIGAI